MLPCVEIQMLDTNLQDRFISHQLPVDPVSLVEQRADGLHHLLPLLIILYGIDGAARAGR